MKILPDKIIKILMKNKFAELNGGQITTRCPICGDSIKHSNSKHMSIKIENMEDDMPFPYHCYRCKASGVVSKEFLKYFEGSCPNEEIIALLKHNKKISKKFNIYSVKKATTIIPNIIDKKSSQVKLKYLNKRLGLQFTYEDCIKHKIIFSIEDLLDENEVEFSTCENEKLFKTLNDYYMGFVSYDNKYVILRNIDVRSNYRYYNYNIYNNQDNSKKFYVIPNKINMYSDTINLHLCEGAFDSLGVLYHVNDGVMSDTDIYAAVGGSGYRHVLQQFILMGFLNINLTIYADNDSDHNITNYIFNDIKKLKKDYKQFINGKIHIVQNIIKKDFGVRKEDIKIKNSYI